MGEERFGHLVFVPGKNKGRYPFSNSLYIDDERKAVIDTACDESILRDLAEERGLDIIINTHYHEDHFTLNYLFSGDYYCLAFQTLVYNVNLPYFYDK